LVTGQGVAATQQWQATLESATTSMNKAYDEKKAAPGADTVALEAERVAKIGDLQVLLTKDNNEKLQQVMEQTNKDMAQRKEQMIMNGIALEVAAATPQQPALLNDFREVSGQYPVQDATSAMGQSVLEQKDRKRFDKEGLYCRGEISPTNQGVVYDPATHQVRPEKDYDVNKEPAAFKAEWEKSFALLATQGYTGIKLDIGSVKPGDTDYKDWTDNLAAKVMIGADMHPKMYITLTTEAKVALRATHPEAFAAAMANNVAIDQANAAKEAIVQGIENKARDAVEQKVDLAVLDRLEAAVDTDDTDDLDDVALDEKLAALEAIAADLHDEAQRMALKVADDPLAASNDPGFDVITKKIEDISDKIMTVGEEIANTVAEGVKKDPSALRVAAAEGLLARLDGLAKTCGGVGNAVAIAKEDVQAENDKKGPQYQGSGFKP
jgi:hypothetical protein